MSAELKPVKTESNNDVELIEYVRQYPELYDPTHPGHKNNTRMNQIWGKSGYPGGGQSARRRWGRLKTMYAKEKRALPSGSSPKPGSTWPHFLSMSFIDPHLKDEIRESSLTKNQSPNEAFKIDEDGEDDEDLNKMDIETIDISSEDRPKQKRKRSSGSVAADAEIWRTKMVDAIDKLSNESHTRGTTFAQYIATELDSMCDSDADEAAEKITGMSKRVKKLVLCIAIGELLEEDERQQKRVRIDSYYLSRHTSGSFANMMPYFRTNSKFCFRYMRMDYPRFKMLHQLLYQRLEKHSHRAWISVEEQLWITLRYLAHGHSFRSMEGDSHIPYNTISIIVNRTCAAIYEVLHEKYLRTPNNSEEWKLIADRFLEKWQLPHCLDSETYSPYFFVGDPAFPLRSDLMKPYGGKNLTIEETHYNYRISRGRVRVENFFGILTSKWRVFHRPIDTSLEHAIDSVKAAVCLHNFLIDEMPQNGNPKSLADTGDASDGKWRQQGSRLDKAQMVPRGANRGTETAKDIRDNLKNWFSNAGAVV
ncbi:DDE superfamily endonuclease domain-containing protein [Ditylenchus destructor]|uniref:DDE superfamily endonuclease domain-containing protein n=1 Tax=Ditylenchus destructor TaxID=166010 RepID=A0AAD4MUK7_9BILA|nr:DDE superfamily endonuclease domain-containing protein [Ditylenchus destructor]